MNIARQIWRRLFGGAKKSIPVMDWFPAHDGRLYKVFMRETETEPRLYICKSDVGFFTMNHDGPQPVMERWRPQ